MGNVLKDLNDLKADLRALLESQPLAVLATQRNGQPYASLVAFAFAEDLKGLFFATTRATRKYANLQASERVAVLVDNRSNQVSDFRLAQAARPQAVQRKWIRPGKATPLRSTSPGTPILENS